jgi:hypothetical protein
VLKITLMVKVIPRAQNVIKCYIPVFHVLLCPLVFIFVDETSTTHLSVSVSAFMV